MDHSIRTHPDSFSGRGFVAQREETVRLLELGETFTADELAARLKISTSRARDVLNELVEWHAVSKSGRPARFVSKGAACRAIARADLAKLEAGS